MALGGELVGWEWASGVAWDSYEPNLPHLKVWSQRILCLQKVQVVPIKSCSEQKTARAALVPDTYSWTARSHTQTKDTMPARLLAWPPPPNSRTSRLLSCNALHHVGLIIIKNRFPRSLFTVLLTTLAGSRLVRRRQIRLLIPHRKRKKAATIESRRFFWPMTRVFQLTTRAFTFSTQHHSITASTHFCSILNNWIFILNFSSLCTLLYPIIWSTAHDKLIWKE